MNKNLGDKKEAERKAIYTCFEVLGNKLRYDIVQLLFEKEMSVLQIAEKTGAEQSRVSHALKILKDCKLIDVEKEGKQNFYFVPEKIIKKFDLKNNPGNVFQMLKEHSDAVCGNCYRQEAKKTKGD